MCPEQVDLARPSVTGVERDVTGAREVLGQVTVLPPDAEDTTRPAAGHVLDGYHDTILPRLAQGSGFPALKRPTWRGRMCDNDGHLHPARQPRNPHQRLFRSKTPCSAVEWRVEGQYRNTMSLGETSQIMLLMRIPAFVHHDLDPVVARLGDPGVHPLEAEGK